MDPPLLVSRKVQSGSDGIATDPTGPYQCPRLYLRTVGQTYMVGIGFGKSEPQPYVHTPIEQRAQRGIIQFGLEAKHLLAWLHKDHAPSSVWQAVAARQIDKTVSELSGHLHSDEAAASDEDSEKRLTLVR